jgi:tRNA pseudouridine38-40 synthase
LRIALGVEYDGTHFHGFQIQPDGLRTVQLELEKAVSLVANEPVKIVCAGRTDSGVHAIEQVVHFDTNAIRDERAWLFGTNTYVPKDISISWVKFVPDDFHARFSAVSRTYRYIIINRPTPLAVQRNYASWCRYPLDIERMQQAAYYLVGEHDFSSFRAAECQAKTAIRTIKKIEIKKEQQQVAIEITANAFLHHMVRNIAGTLMAVGAGKKPPEWVDALLKLKDRTQGDTMASASGLYLLKIEY